MNSRRGPCPFCDHVLAGRDRIIASGRFTVAFEDAYPSAPGHTLIIPRRHVGRLLDLADDEAAELWEAAMVQLRRLETSGRPDAYTVGVNDGSAAGQTVPHVHLHLIPRRVGDTPDPRGGVRLVLPGTARYWDKAV